MHLDYPLGTNRAFDDAKEAAVESGFAEIEGETFYRIADSDRMDPFLMNVVSGSNHWMFAGSNGAVTAGRRNADHALFPYCTQDKLFESYERVGSCSLIWVKSAEGDVLWEPFRSEIETTGRRRNLFKSLDGNKIVFEEVDPSLGLRFRYSWTSGEAFGFIRQAELFNEGPENRSVRILDGIQNVVPYGLDQTFLSHFSNLADAYKKNELLEAEGLGIYYLSSIPTDRAEPSEGLKASVVWSVGLERSQVLLSSRQLQAFREGAKIRTEDETRGERGSYLVESSFALGKGEGIDWWLAADIEQDAVQVEALRKRFREAPCMVSELKKDIAENQATLRAKIAASDGLQLTGNQIRDARHRSNTLFNLMRGGVFDDAYTLSVEDFVAYLGSWNKELKLKYEERLEALGVSVRRDELVSWAREQGDSDLYRIASEYLPLSFSRRHGDPSRPWNKFSIEMQDDEGKPVLAYQGNWRDIFQNWEPLGYAYPEYLTGMIFRFLNATTADGYNPYRVTRDGFDWEVLDPSEPWSNIGYWGDHQIVYLLKLLEALKKHSPHLLLELLGEECFVYAHVPYRIRDFRSIWKDPRQTIFFDDAAAETLATASAERGADGKLLCRADGERVRANLLEKLISPLLAKLSNFVLDGGIWMNTQRPEWNDANNALVGYGVSVVTLCYVNRYLEFLETLLSGVSEEAHYRMDADLAAFLNRLDDAFSRFEPVLEGKIDSLKRYELLEALGIAGEMYRKSVYDVSIGGSRVEVKVTALRSFLQRAKAFAGHTIDSNRRSDDMYHSYNLLRPVGESEVEIGRLPEMLEGQVAVLSANRLTGDEVLKLLDSLRRSRLYREDVESYLLYPDKELPRFLDKNQVDATRVGKSRVLQAMLAAGDKRILSEDSNGVFRFNGSFKNAGDVQRALTEIGDEYPVCCEDSEEVLRIFEDTFDHRSFTGRSGTFFAYEGLGSVYWHMVSKLLLAIQENCFKERGNAAYESLVARYFETLAGLGFDKAPEEYGAFPIDAYSHTPKHMGAQQPGMTGQVKEDILSRWGELGVFVSQGSIRFQPDLLRSEAFIQDMDTFNYLDLWGRWNSIELSTGMLAFTYCQTPFVYRLSDVSGVALIHADGAVERRDDLELSATESASLFARRGQILRVEVSLVAGDLCQLPVA
ncbi:hypothetical protein QEH56_19365 [Pelagicoccus enzymogenes]|uniref:hypothetical protein n=1 Tax=Pelagicoccus enzymogenes TaxID=2773457 RepID=UPI00280FDBF1|nr:hypothetical protein [Pelagicoccus enzymogenes]MDQ8200332.1 hypothetical protein [Pelagicoccus enzymogenes]